MAKALMILGVVIFIVGLILNFKDALPWLKYLGHLPGDISIKREGFEFYFPAMTSLLLSLILTGLIWLFRR